MKKFALTFAIGLLLAWLLVSNLQKSASQSQARRGPGGPAVVAVEVASLSVGNLVDAGSFVGSIEPVAKFTVAPRISGRLKKLYVDIGDRIDNGAVIAALDDEELLLGVKQAEADLEIARANYSESASLLEISQRELERVKKMRQQKVSSEVEVENVEASHKTRQARHQVNKALLSQKESALATARLKLDYATVDASWSGTAGGRFVAERFLNEGAMVNANSAIVSVIDIATLTGVIDVVERDYFKIRQGMHVEIETAAMPGRVFAARVSRIAPLLNEISRQARIELELANPDFALKPGMFISARITYARHEQVTYAPAEALVRRNDREGVFLVDRDKHTASFVPIEVGFRESARVEIASPTIAGDVVVLGHHLVEDGSAVRLAGQENLQTVPGKGSGPGQGKEEKRGGRQP